MSLALYRKYRPGTFAEVKGQEHVTEPLRQALRTGRINHAYLFSGPRGCGKTSSARILARSLNCEKGPTPDPCGECESCVALAPTGPGHLDVIEIDAASHGGVDDARDLRERAFFAPVSARFKIYIIDEAHMVTREGFNALLKLVEEPPPHLKFVFATTEPEKVIGTIKSRTHHYPFRLMPPTTLRALLEEILTSESVPFEPPALPLVVRAGAGSARDSLSILDQLMAGADDAGITYARAVSLLGYTDGDLLDEVVGAFAAGDGARVFQTVGRVIEGGHDPRRFAMDLLERFRDLVILANVPEAAGSGLLDRPADELERLREQAASMGPAELTRAAEVFNAGLTEMRGATSPRLLLELMCARVLLPSAAQGEAALLARLERLERSGPAPAPVQAAVQQAPIQQAPLRQAPAPAAVPAAPPVRNDPEPGRTAPAPAETAPRGGDDWPAAVRPGGGGAPPSSPEAAPSSAPASAPAAPAASPGGDLQQSWPAVLGALKRRSIVVWANVNTNAQVVGVEGNLVTLGFAQIGAMKNFVGGGKDTVVAAALGDVLGGHWRVEAVAGSGGGPSAPFGAGVGPPSRPGGGSRGPQPSAPSPAQPGGPSGPQGGSQGRKDESQTQAQAQPARPAQASAAPEAAPDRVTTDESWPSEPPPDDPGSPPAPTTGSTTTRPSAKPSAGMAAARTAAQAAQAHSRTRGQGNGGSGGNGNGGSGGNGGGKSAGGWPDAVPGRQGTGGGQVNDEVDPENDADADVDELSGMALIQRELGGQIIGEIDHT
ncbi:DNA polymerase III subunit gamma and tau [Spongiactinospora sp. TRM90649]|uniref:DNA polymerase III subunit gamma and tau n=1 Tax=Spongiactinospora sp. TRM90649 TaxID=3031114 RepID=UPI0023F81C3E|nr:DNA polymerase III subunit gamma and tau [Spongiactinospora sp. TRM90649]MDF5756080.1 DNA polymerase III subunit gamma and tau [Spongiactinospora sp. TRM90649]